MDFEIADEDLRLRGPAISSVPGNTACPDLKNCRYGAGHGDLKTGAAGSPHDLTQDFALEQPEHRGLRAEVNNSSRRW